MPLFHEYAHSFVTVKHGMDVIKDMTNDVNEDQTPILTVDQPLYAIDITVVMARHLW